MRSLRILVAVTLLIAASVAFAGETGSISGKVADANGGPLPGVMVKVSGPQMPAGRTFMTGPTGAYNFQRLAPGKYTVEASLQGLGQASKTVDVQVDRDYQVNLVLKGGTEAVVEVTASSVDQKSTEVASNFATQEIRQLPISRTYEGLLNLIPGAPATDGSGYVSVAGGTRQDNKYLVDGVNITNAGYGYLGIETNELDIADVNVKTGAISAEFGRTNGAVVNAVTKSGTNDLHGGLRFEASPRVLRGRQQVRDLARHRQLQRRRQPRIPDHQGHPLRLRLGPLRRHDDERTVGDDRRGHDDPARHEDQGDRLLREADRLRRRALAHQRRLPRPPDQDGRRLQLELRRGLRGVERRHQELRREPRRRAGSRGRTPSSSSSTSTSPRNRPPRRRTSSPTGPTRSRRRRTSAPTVPTRTRPATAGTSASTPSPTTGEQYTRDEFKLTASQYFDWGETQHQVKVGGGAEFIDFERTPGRRTAGGPSPTRRSPASRPSAPATTPPSRSRLGAARTYSAFVQDTVTWKRLSATVGFLFNFDDFAQTCDAGQVCGSANAPPLTEDARYNFMTFRWQDQVQPRIGVVYNAELLTGDKFYANYGKYAGLDQKSTIRSFAPYRIREDETFFRRDNGAFILSRFRGSSSGKFIPSDLPAPYQDEFVFGYEAPVTKILSVDVRYQYRSLKNPFEDAPINPDNYFGSFQAKTFPNASRIYRGYSLDLTKRYANNWYATLSYTYSTLRGNWDEDYGDRAVQHVFVPRGRAGRSTAPSRTATASLLQDRPHIFKLMASYDLAGFTFGGFLRYQSGRAVGGPRLHAELRPVPLPREGRLAPDADLDELRPPPGLQLRPQREHDPPRRGTRPERLRQPGDHERQRGPVPRRVRGRRPTAEPRPAADEGAEPALRHGDRLGLPAAVHPLGAPRTSSARTGGRPRAAPGPFAIPGPGSNAGPSHLRGDGPEGGGSGPRARRSASAFP